jgi:hypothetical protein
LLQHPADTRSKRCGITYHEDKNLQQLRTASAWLPFQSEVNERGRAELMT